ncbi:MAG: hypothetical protein JO007_14280 [Alphaproteobacteria bacterium]|nr:hypothetical protein [Alphaproteobacteria bacterium]
MIGLLSKRLSCAKQMVCSGQNRRNRHAMRWRIVMRRGVRLTAIASLLAMSLAACQGTNQSAFIGPNPGGGTPCPHNAFEDCAER